MHPLVSKFCFSEFRLLLSRVTSYLQFVTINFMINTLKKITFYPNPELPIDS